MAGEGIAAAGIVGIALETTIGTYAAPTKFFPVTSEDLKRSQTNYKRRVIRNTADQIGQVAGSSLVEGTLDIEALHDVLPYFLMAGRFDVVQTGTGPFIYTASPIDDASVEVGNSLSITVVRNGIVFGYVGCVVSKFTFNLSDEYVLMCSMDILGMDEAVDDLPTPTWPTSTPPGAGSHVTQVNDVTATDFDDFEFTIDNAGEAQYRLNANRGPTFIKWGERTTTVTAARDFINRTDYDAYKALTAQKIDVTSTVGAHSIYMEVPVAIKQTYEIPQSSPGDLVMANIEYDGVYHAATGGSVKMIITSDEDIEGA